VEKHKFVFDVILNEEVTKNEVYHERVEYMSSYLDSQATTIRKGEDVRGYFVCYLLDNFEWKHVGIGTHSMFVLPTFSTHSSDSIKIIKTFTKNLFVVNMKQYLMDLYKYVQKGGWLHVINENNHDAILKNMLLNLKLFSGDHSFSCIIGSINFKQWDP